MFSFRRGSCTIVNYLVKIVVHPVTANMEFEEASALLFEHCNLLWVDSSVFKLKFY
jgi:hypothetical protein